jgi:PAS domain S-box-containing protein
MEKTTTQNNSTDPKKNAASKDREIPFIFKKTALNAFIEKINEAMVIIDIESGQYIDCNPQMEKMFGYTREELLQMRSGDLTVDHTIQSVEKLRQLESDQSLNGEKKMITKTGEIIPVRYSLTSLSLNEKKYTITLLRNIIEEERAKNDLRDISRIPSENPNPILRISADGILLYANEASKEMLKVWETSVGQPIPTLKFQMIKQAALSDKQSLIEIDCQDRTYEIFVAPVEQMNYINLYGRDITEDKKIERALSKSEERLMKLNRVLLAHNKSNQARLKIKNEKEYLNEVCKIIAEVCEHPMVWIGFSSNDEEKSVKPVAYAGFEPEYINSLQVTWEDNPHGRGPSGTAIRTGKTVVSKDIRTDPNFEPWKKDALELGYRSAIAFPFASNINNKFFGSLSIYAEESDAFADPEEVELLSDLVLDIATSINTFRMESLLEKDEQKLRTSENRYRALFKQMTEGFALHEIVSDKNGEAVDYRFLEVNDAFEKIVGIDRNDILLKLQSEILPDEDPAFVKIYEEVVKTQTPIHFTKYSKALKRYLSIVAFSTEPGKFATMLNDITEQKQAEDAKNNFIAIMAHELRNPLMPISVNAELLETYASDATGELCLTEPQIKESASIIVRQTKTLARLLDDLLDISRIIHGKIILKKQIIDVSSPIRTAIEAVEPFIRSQKHTFLFALPKTPIYLNADPIRIEQIITNLLNNAAKYTKPGGQITLTVTPEKDMVSIIVRDNGIGIEKNNLEKIFEMFTQTSKPFVESHGDFGIGLKITKDIVKLHGGTIEVRSAGTDFGSEFVVLLPVRNKLDDIKSNKNGESLPKSVKRKILVVDDNEDIANSLRRVLGRLGNTVHVANDGSGAILSASEFLPEMAFLDIGLPDMTGYEVATELRKKYGRSIKLVALTGYGQEKDKLLAKEAGFDFHMTKPVSISEIKKVIEDCFKK